MKIEHKVEITDPEFILLLEINERVKRALSRINENKKIRTTDLESLKIDKNSIQSLTRELGSKRKLMANNLTNKIEYIVKTQEKSDWIGLVFIFLIF